MKTSKFILLIICIAAWISPTKQLAAQDSLYARQVTGYLSSEVCKGRGYAFRGDSIAAEYIRQEMRQLKVEPLVEDYWQYFTFNYNKMEGNVTVDLRESYPSRTQSDCLQVSALSVGTKGTYKIVQAEKLMKNKRFADRLLAAQQSANFLYRSGKSPCRKQVIAVDMSTMADDTLATQWWSKNVIWNYLGAKGYLLLKDKLSPYSPGYGRFKTNHILITLLRDSVKNPLTKVRIDLDAQYIQPYRSQNVCGYIRGKRYPDSCIVIGAHYDHCGMVGRDYIYPGANDNACGVAMMLDLARHYALPENEPDYSMFFLAFSGEEIGLLGSTHFVEHLPDNMPAIKLMINLDLVGTNEEGFAVVGGKTFHEIFAKMESINEVKQYAPTLRNGDMSANSDHYPFYKAGYPAVFIFGMGKSGGYHHPSDTLENLSMGGYKNLFWMIRDLLEYNDRGGCP